MYVLRCAAIEWSLHENLQSIGGNPLAETLQPVYAKEAGYVAYNDEWPDGTVSFHLAHAKGGQHDFSNPDGSPNCQGS